MVQYLTAAEIRANINVTDTTEWPDAAVNEILKEVSAYIDFYTGRTWGGIVQVSNQYLDGTGTSRLQLPVKDLLAVTAIAIDDDIDGVYSSITINSSSLTLNSTGDFIRFYNFGLIELDPDAEVNLFALGSKTVKITYQYGISAATDDVKDLCTIMFQNKMKYSQERQDEIIRRLNELKYQSFF
jgi:hypothetical protein